MKVQMLKSVGDCKKDEVYDLPYDRANYFVSIGAGFYVTEKVDTSNYGEPKQAVEKAPTTKQATKKRKYKKLNK